MLHISVLANSKFSFLWSREREFETIPLNQLKPLVLNGLLKMVIKIGNILQYISNEVHNSAATYLFAEVINLTKNLWDAILTWYSRSATHQIYLYDLNNDLGIHCFNPSWSCMIVEVLATLAKFLAPFVIALRSIDRSVAIWPTTMS